MTALNKEQVRHIAKLARLRLTPAEEEKFPKELSGILDYVNMLSEVDTKGVEATAQVTGQTNSFRDDAIGGCGADTDALIACSGLPIVERQIVTPSAHG